jgi:iron complex outermembrane receptor protein
VLALAIGSIATGAQAQSTLDEVVVTARKVAEPARAAPLVIDVVPAGRLVAGDVDGLASLAARVPGLSFESLWGGQGSAPVLRGLSQPSTAGDNVGVFVDGVYQASRAALNVDPFDLERIEVVRGPQSALFGQSTFAGAIHYVPRAPTATPEAGARLDVGSDALAGLQAWLSGPRGDSPARPTAPSTTPSTATRSAATVVTVTR